MPGDAEDIDPLRSGDLVQNSLRAFFHTVHHVHLSHLRPFQFKKAAPGGNAAEDSQE
jgi:hypothetical protein